MVWGSHTGDDELTVDIARALQVPGTQVAVLDVQNEVVGWAEVEDAVASGLPFAVRVTDADLAHAIPLDFDAGIGDAGGDSATCSRLLSEMEVRHVRCRSSSDGWHVLVRLGTPMPIAEASRLIRSMAEMWSSLDTAPIERGRLWLIRPPLSAHRAYAWVSWPTEGAEEAARILRYERATPETLRRLADCLRGVAGAAGGSTPYGAGALRSESTRLDRALSRPGLYPMRSKQLVYGSAYRMGQLVDDVDPEAVAEAFLEVATRHEVGRRGATRAITDGLAAGNRRPRRPSGSASTSAAIREAAIWRAAVLSMDWGAAWSGPLVAAVVADQLAPAGRALRHVRALPCRSVAKTVLERFGRDLSPQVVARRLGDLGAAGLLRRSAAGSMPVLNGPGGYATMTAARYSPVMPADAVRPGDTGEPGSKCKQFVSSHLQLRALMAALGDQSLTARELARAAAGPWTPDHVRRYLNPWVELGEVERVEDVPLRWRYASGRSAETLTRSLEKRRAVVREARHKRECRDRLQNALNVVGSGWAIELERALSDDDPVMRDAAFSVRLRREHAPVEITHIAGTHGEAWVTVIGRILPEQPTYELWDFSSAAE